MREDVTFRDVQILEQVLLGCRILSGSKELHELCVSGNKLGVKIRLITHRGKDQSHPGQDFGHQLFHHWTVRLDSQALVKLLIGLGHRGNIVLFAARFSGSDDLFQCRKTLFAQCGGAEETRLQYSAHQVDLSDIIHGGLMNKHPAVRNSNHQPFSREELKGAAQGVP